MWMKVLELKDDTKLGSQQLDSQTGVQIDTRQGAAIS